MTLQVLAVLTGSGELMLVHALDMQIFWTVSSARKVSLATQSNRYSQYSHCLLLRLVS